MAQGGQDQGEGSEALANNTKFMGMSQMWGHIWKSRQI